jgi:hypothetical protein
LTSTIRRWFFLSSARNGRQKRKRSSSSVPHEAVGAYKSAVSGDGVYPSVTRLNIAEIPPHLPLSHGYHPSVFISRSCAVSWPCFLGVQVYLVIRPTS